MTLAVPGGRDVAALIAFVAATCAAAWMFVSSFGPEDDWRGFVALWAMHIPLFVALLSAGASAVAAWLMTAPISVSSIRGVVAGLIAVVLSALVTVLVSGVLAGEQNVFSAVFYGLLFFPLWLSLPEAWPPLLAMPVVGVFASAWARQIDVQVDASE